MEYGLTRGQTGCGSYIEFIAGGLLGGGGGGGCDIAGYQKFLLGLKVQHLMVVILLRVTNFPNQMF